MGRRDNARSREAAAMKDQSQRVARYLVLLGLMECASRLTTVRTDWQSPNDSR